MSYLADGNYVVVPDLQAPYHDKRTVETFTKFLWDYDHDGLLIVGDEADSPEPARWNKGMAMEYAGTLEAGLQTTYDVLRGLCHATGLGVHGSYKPVILSRSNHGDRIQKYLAKYAPAMARASWSQYDRIMGYNGHKPLLEGRDEPLPIRYETKPIPFARGWLMMHGDEAGMNQTAGGTALGLAKKVGLSVVCGHTHKAGIQHMNLAHSGRVTQQLVGFEVGHMMDMKQAGYLGFGGANWQQAFGIMRIRKGVVYPELVLINNRKFTVEGHHYGA